LHLFSDKSCVIVHQKCEVHLH